MLYVILHEIGKNLSILELSTRVAYKWTTWYILTASNHNALIQNRIQVDLCDAHIIQTAYFILAFYSLFSATGKFNCDAPYKCYTIKYHTGENLLKVFLRKY
jgi:hypothetical protein